GTWAGCLAVSVAAALPDARVLAIEASADALAVAQVNMEQHGLDARIECMQGDLLAPLAECGFVSQIDVIVSNPPYIPDLDLVTLQPEVRCFEPHLALAGGPDGMDVHRRLLQQAPVYLKSGGVLLMEVGLGQAAAVCREAEESGWFRTYDVLRDEGGIDRVVCFEKKEEGRNGGFKWSSQHLNEGGCDEHSKAAFGSVWAAPLAVTRSTVSGRRRGTATVLGSDRGRHGQ
ncbi:MAG TPA: HemK family protein methyltransferase, partial [Nitrospira sp.]|nr:HemK family protein methyltransferase [Nitrospira sp.]